MPSRTTWYILTPTFAISGLLLMIGLGGAYYVHRVNSHISGTMDANLAVEQFAGQLALDTREFRMQLMHYQASGTPHYLQIAQNYLGEVRQQLNAIAVDISAGQSQLELPIETFEKDLRALVDASSDHRAEMTRTLIESSTAQLVAPAEKFLLDRQALAKETSRQNIAIARRIGHGLLLLGVCGAVAGLLMGLGIARRVHRTLVEISVPVHNIAGQLNEVVGPIQVSSNVALSQLDDSLRMLADKTADVVRRLQESQQETLRHEQLAAVGQLAAGLAHELRNPLMSVKLIVQTAAERDNESLNKRDLAVMEDELVRLEKMLQSFLDFARPPRLNPSPIELVTFLSKTMDVIRIRAEQQDVRLHLDLPLENGCPEKIVGDEAQLRQVLLNMLINALDVLPGGGNIWVTASSYRVVSAAEHSGEYESDIVPAGDYVAISVADDGPGISEEVSDKLFDPFISTKLTGMGLGLSICRQIVAAHRGRIFVDPVVEIGARFTVELPATG